MIEIDSLVKVYNGRRAKRALDSITFTVERGDLFGFLGPNGAGKTTTIRILATLLEPTDGTAIIDGHDIRDDPIAIRDIIGYSPENPGFYPTMRGRDHLLYWAEFYGIPKAERRRQAKDLLALVDLEEDADTKLKAYSHGMRQRLALAQALLNDPPILILDEPAGGLDPAGMRFFRELMKRFNSEGKTIFLSSHLLSEVEMTCKTVGVIHRGKMMEVSGLSTLQNRIAQTRETSIHVETDDLSEKAVAAVRSMEGVLDVEVSGASLVIRVEANSELAADINSTLLAHGARVRSLKQQEVSLEDVFVALTEGS
ncbi:MAG: ABC transporter ATP-binding protein [Candidatus Thermoplasmatota archaeon]|nr:ABC transporter ATP-binding protein [Candidatus Thermoplasmatota archaeon]